MKTKSIDCEAIGLIMLLLMAVICLDALIFWSYNLFTLIKTLMAI